MEQTTNPDDLRAESTEATIDQILPKRNKPGPKKKESTELLTPAAVKTLDAKQQVWLSALVTAMANLATRSVEGIERCIPIADEAVIQFTKRWK